MCKCVGLTGRGGSSVSWFSLRKNVTFNAIRMALINSECLIAREWLCLTLAEVADLLELVLGNVND